MRRSKLEMYVDILSVLAQRGPLKLTHVMYKANVNCSVLKENLDFLTKQGLVEEKIIGRERLVYAITYRWKASCSFRRYTTRHNCTEILQGT